MKVYIVTSGCYSDYRIGRVFSNKEKAEFYAKGIYEANDIEEYELDDDKSIELYTSIYLSYDIDSNEFNVNFNICNSLDKPFEASNKTMYSDFIKVNQDGRYASITLVRSITKIDLTIEEKEKYEDRYMKVIYDLEAQIKYMKEHDGFNETQIQEWLKNK